ncbi:MAG: tRNA (adenosine(37)-N6)-threonylcarbamoyltransferase complex ATPase subunit type 1 TsaE [Gemmatimonadetes bacterium]|nr:tRNA (adenosine(37)-N6)-threonylcarbamoyltransferase complex ATPase subunit type 1 TsaE [Gemmatimonadota bacterium]NIU35696.1 tRNA (adenosine(37)-N6)-threonylcarbamoyltransferase complex ATPase subunit type 1 TsaE [Gemmatimonadota bacterium]
MILDEEDLVRWGREVGRGLETPVFIGLKGPLGAGKSVLARAIARGAGVDRRMPSPTFNLLFRYPAAGGRTVVHVDLYRLEDPGELWELGWEELGAEEEVVLVEWPERAGELLPADRWEVTLEVPGSGTEVDGPRARLRVVTVERIGDPPDLPGAPS